MRRTCDGLLQGVARNASSHQNSSLQHNDMFDTHYHCAECNAVFFRSSGRKRLQGRLCQRLSLCVVLCRSLSTLSARCHQGFPHSTPFHDEVNPLPETHKPKFPHNICIQVILYFSKNDRFLQEMTDFTKPCFLSVLYAPSHL